MLPSRPISALFWGRPGEPFRQRLYGDDTAREIDCAIRRAVLTAFDRAVGVLTENRNLLEKSAQLLLQQETLDAPELEGLFKSLKPAPTEFSASVARCNGQTVS